MASDIITTYSAMGRLKTPRAFVTSSPRSRTAEVVTRSTPAEAEWIHRRRGERETMWSSTDAGTAPTQEHLRLVECRLVGVTVDPAVGRDPGAAHAVDRLDPGGKVSRERDAEDRGGEDGEWRLAQDAVPSMRAIHCQVTDLVERGELLGAGPYAVQELATALGDDTIGESLAGGVLLHLQVEPREPHDRALECAASLAPPLESIVDLGEAGQDPGAGRVHDVVRVALEQRHERLRAIEGLPLARGHDPLDPVALAARHGLAQATHQPARLGGQLLDRLGHELRRSTVAARRAPRTRRRASPRAAR